MAQHTLLPIIPYDVPETPVTAEVVDAPPPAEVVIDQPAPINHIGEIFVGASRLEPPELWWENSAYPPVDELLYEVLSASGPSERRLPEILPGVWAAFDDVLLKKAV